MRRFLRRFVQSEDGVTAVEAGILLPVFIPLLLGTFELLFALYASAELERKGQDAVREIRLGTAGSNAAALSQTPEQYLRSTICDNLMLSDCYNDLTLNFKIYDKNGQFESNVGYQFIEPNKIATVDIHLDLDIVGILSAIRGKPMSATSSILFHTEPF